MKKYQWPLHFFQRSVENMSFFGKVAFRESIEVCVWKARRNVDIDVFLVSLLHEFVFLKIIAFAIEILVWVKILSVTCQATTMHFSSK